MNHFMNRSLKNAALGLVLVFGMQSVSMQANPTLKAAGIGIATGLASVLGSGIANYYGIGNLAGVPVGASLHVISPLLAGVITKKLVTPNHKETNPALIAATMDTITTGVTYASLALAFANHDFLPVLFASTMVACLKLALPCAVFLDKFPNNKKITRRGSTGSI